MIKGQWLADSESSRVFALSSSYYAIVRSHLSWQLGNEKLRKGNFQSVYSQIMDFLAAGDSCYKL